MKKRLALTALAAVAVGVMATPSWAFTSAGISTVTAGTTVGGPRTAAFTLAIRDTSNPFGANQSSVTWSNVNPLSTTWKLADRLLVINSTVTDAAGGIKIYTDNTSAAANPRFVDPTPANAFNADSLASGLLRATSPTTSVAGLPMAWTIKTSTRIIEGGTTLTGVGAADPNTGSTGAVYNNKFQWLFHTDAYNWALGVDLNGNTVLDPGEPQPQALDAPFVTMINSFGTHFGQAPTEFEAHPDGANSFVYLEANFATAQVQTPYQTSTLKVEAYIQ